LNRVPASIPQVKALSISTSSSQPWLPKLTTCITIYYIELIYNYDINSSLLYWITIQKIYCHIRRKYIVLSY